MGLTLREEVAALRVELSTKIDKFIDASNSRDLDFAKQLGALETEVKNLKDTSFWTPASFTRVGGMLAAAAAVVTLVLKFA
ncbi:MAG: hypothetical protein KGJ86_00220 [Chloroflexota bacterium]|nr:hypothetical protein [Chloroflexota bacterium]